MEPKDAPTPEQFKESLVKAIDRAAAKAEKDNNPQDEAATDAMNKAIDKLLKQLGYADAIKAGKKAVKKYAED